MLEILDCKGKAFNQSLIGQVIKDRYKVKKLLNVGNFSNVYEIEDLRNDSQREKKLAMKICDDTEEMALEIRRLRKIYKEYQRMKENDRPAVIMRNSQEEDIDAIPCI